MSSKGEFEKIYDFYLSQEAKKMSRDLYLRLNDKPNTFLFEKENIIAKDNKGYAIKYLLDKNSKQYLRHYVEFIYENDDWLYNSDATLKFCIRESAYDMPEEFKRALSLIIQRFKQSENKGNVYFGKQVEDISNCLNIQYANSENEMEGAEGLFLFTPSQSLEKKDILVSPKYSAKDDLLTAILLVHEITHAIDNNTRNDGEFIQMDYDKNKKYEPGDVLPANAVKTYSGCYALEANAFSTQNLFVSTLNKEEFNSLVSRARTNSSSEAYQALLTYFEISNFKGENYFEKAMNFVKSNPAYQKQCEDK